MPVLTLDVGRSAAGRRLARARAEAAAPRLTRRALFEQARLVATADLGELLDTAPMLATRPVPAGNRAGVVADAEAAACSPPTRAAIWACSSPSWPRTPSERSGTSSVRRRGRRGGRCRRGVTAGLFPQYLGVVGADPGMDALLAVTATTATTYLVSEVRAARLPVPVPRSVMDQVGAVRLLRPGENSPAVPAYAYPESAARALGHAARFGIRRAAPPGSTPGLDGLRRDQARDLVTRFLARSPRGGWLSDEQVTELLGCYGVRLADHVAVTTEEAALVAAARFAAPWRSRRTCPAWCAGATRAPSCLAWMVRRRSARVPHAPADLRQPAGRRYRPAGDHRRGKVTINSLRRRCSARWCCSGWPEPLPTSWRTAPPGSLR